MGCGCGSSKNNPEFNRRWKQENNTGCCVGSRDNSCDAPSLAAAESPLAEWEAKYGKLRTTVTFVQNEFGHTVQVVEKKPCPLEVAVPKRNDCCTLRYKIVR